MTQSEFLNIVSPFKDKLYRLSKRLLVSHEEAQDATQEVMIKLWNQKSKMADYKNVEAFSMTLTKNYCLDRLRSKQSQNLRIVHSNYEEKQTRLDKHLEQKDSVSWMSKLMEELPEQQRMVIQLRDIEQYEFDEIAKVLDMNETAIRVALSRARKVLRTRLMQTHNYGVK